MSDPVLPGWMLIERAGSPLRTVGYVTETEAGGVKFLELQVPNSTGKLERRQLINAATVRTMVPLSRDDAVVYARRQWRGAS